MNWIESILIGLLQGFTEFLPISSSGHIELAKVLLGADIEEGLRFQIIIHIATMISTLVVFRKDIFLIFKDLLQFKKTDDSLFALKILLSMIPLGIVYYLFGSQAEELFEGRAFWVGAMLLVTGSLMFATLKMSGKDKKITFLMAIIIGLFQAAAIIPGISRSGATLAAALFMGAQKDQATRFSFLMIIPPMLGATLLQFKELSDAGFTASHENNMLAIAFIAALVSGIVACKWMINIVRKGNLFYFGIYCFAIGIIAMIWSSQI
ncbi:MAG: undecaprenyl-diphosphate phosphatase [Chitinophagaceae bacterium]|nr:MAG: undecaprenyl-diphosphate phosphatase [Chitinophagaceae bacterium]